MLVGLGLNVSLMSMSLLFGSSMWSHIFVLFGGSRHSDYLILGKSVLYISASKHKVANDATTLMFANLREEDEIYKLRINKGQIQPFQNSLHRELYQKRANTSSKLQNLLRYSVMRNLEWSFQRVCKDAQLHDTTTIYSIPDILDLKRH